MNNSIFLRIYGGMLAVLVLVALLGVLSLHWSTKCALPSIARAWPRAPSA